MPAYSTDLNLSAYPQVDEKKNPDVYVDLTNVHLAIRRLQAYMDAYTGAVVSVVAAATINVGQFVHIGAGSGNAAAGLAIATTHINSCDGFAITSAAAGESVDVQTFGIWPYGNNLLTVGARYYLSTAAGSISTTAPVGAGQLVQYVGIAIDNNNLLFRPAGKYVEL